MNVSVKLSRLISDDFANAYELLLKSTVSIKGAAQIARQYRQICKAIKEYASKCEDLNKDAASEMQNNLTELLNSDVELTQINGEDVSDIKLSTEQYMLIADLINN